MNDSNLNLKSRTLAKRPAFVLALLCALSVLFAIPIHGQNLSDAEIRQQAERLQRGDEETRRDALHKLRVSESKNASRIAAEGLTDKSEIVRATAPFSVLALSTDEAAENLLPQLKDRSEYVRRETAYALGKTRNIRATQPLLDILQRDREYSVRCAAAVALGEIGDITATAALIRVLQRNPRFEEEFLRRAAARSIGQIAETTLLKDFLAQAEVRDFDTFVLANRQSLSEKYQVLETAVGFLIKMLQNQNEADDPKREAAFALGAIGNPQALPILQLNLNAEDYYRAEISREAVRKILSSP